MKFWLLKKAACKMEKNALKACPINSQVQTRITPFQIFNMMGAFGNFGVEAMELEK